MRIALVSPYSWTYQGGVNRHVEALAEQFIARGDHVRVLAPWDPPDAISRRLHRSQPDLREAPDYLVPLGRTLGIGANGAVSNLSVFPEGPISLRRELRAGDYDVVHVHEPLAPIVGWDAMTFRGAPVVGTFHAYSTKPFPNHAATLLGARRRFNQLSARIAVSEAAAWTGRRWFGGEYTIVPNGVDLEAAPRGPEDPERGAAAALRRPRRGAQGPAGPAHRLRGAGRARAVAAHGGRAPTPRRSRAASPTPTCCGHIDVLGKVSDSVLWRQLGEADVLCAPSLAGESFGMVLIEAMAAGTPVIASQIAGYSDVVTNGVDGILVPPADPQALAEELQILWHEPERLAAMGEAGRRSAERYAWPRIAEEVSGGLRAGDRARPAPRSCRVEDAARRTGHRPRRRRPAPSRPAPASLEPDPGRRPQPRPPRSPQGGRGGGGRAGPRADSPCRPPDRRRPGRLQHHRLGPEVGAGRLRTDGRGDVRPRRLLGRDRPRGAAAAARSAGGTSPRRR